MQLHYVLSREAYLSLKSRIATIISWRTLNTLRPRQYGRRFADDTFKRIFLNENVRISIKISLKFIPRGPINNNPALVQIMAWHRPGDKPISEPMMGALPTQICVTRPEWVNRISCDVYVCQCNYLCEGLSFIYIYISKRQLPIWSGFGKISSRYFCSMFNIWNANCVWAPVFIFDSQADVLVKVLKFQLSDSCPML